MNFKLLFPVYRSRYKWIEQTLMDLAKLNSMNRALSLGCGEGEGDPCIAFHAKSVIACDINADDVAYAKNINKNIANLTYEVADATKLRYENASFDLVVCSEVIEHVGKPEQRLLSEISRVLQKGGVAVVTFPTESFPITYDPINRIAAFFGKKRLIPWGAYAFGHDYLIDNQQFRDWCADYNLTIEEDITLSGYLVGLLEIYWTGILQAIFKRNAKNLSSGTDVQKGISYRPSFGDPKLGILTAAILWLDRRFFLRHDYGVLKGFVLRKS